MARTKKAGIPLQAKDDYEQPISKTNNTLIFISHDTRDGEIAEAFSKLLSSVSAGVLKSFRSSDKKGTQGIEYGVEWFPEVMKKLDESSDIVCLLTKNSVDRPWILYEAGVAKGKLATTVLGLAIGIPLSKANTGPFAQFQNCSDDEDSLTKLVMQLVRRIPNAEPVEEIVREQVKVFKTKLTELQKKQPKEEKVVTEEDSVSKLFEEVKIMFKDLPHRIDRRLDPEGRRRKARFRPIMLDELTRLLSDLPDSHYAFLIMISLVKDDLPWFYEIGTETYRIIKTSKSANEKNKALNAFERALDLLHHPIMHEYYMQSEDQYIINEYYHAVRRFLSRYYNETSIK